MGAGPGGDPGGPVPGASCASLGLTGPVRSKTVHTTVSDPDGVRAADFVKHQFTADAPNRLRVADLTYSATWAGHRAPCSLSTCSPAGSSAEKRAYRRKPISSSMRSTEDCFNDTTTGKRGMASLCTIPAPAAQYTLFRFAQHLPEPGADASIGTVGDTLDNEPTESTIGGMRKTELIKPRRPWHTMKVVDVAIAA